MATLDTINLTSNSRWNNEFEGSSLENTERHTEDGRKYVYQAHKPKSAEMVFECVWLSYAVVKELKALRDSGAVAVLTHNDGRTFDVILKSVQAEPVRGTNKHAESSNFSVILNFIEV